MIVITDLQGGGWDDWKFKSKKDLKNFLQSESCSASGYSDKEYYKVNADVSLDFTSASSSPAWTVGKKIRLYVSDIIFR
mgnify:CR=1 FL=1